MVHRGREYISPTKVFIRLRSGSRFVLRNIVAARAVYEVSPSGRICDPAYYDFICKGGADYSIPCAAIKRMRLWPKKARIAGVDMKGALL